MSDELERVSKDQDLEPVSMDEIEAEGATALPNKEVMSLLDVNANVDLGLDLAAPVDLAAAANLNVAAPIEAAASANLLSDDAQAVAVSQQHGTIDQGISGSAEATAPQNAEHRPGPTTRSGRPPLRRPRRVRPPHGRRRDRRGRRRGRRRHRRGAGTRSAA